MAPSSQPTSHGTAGGLVSLMLLLLMAIVPPGVRGGCTDLSQSECCGLLCIGSLDQFRFCQDNAVLCGVGCAAFFAGCQTCTWCGIGYCTTGTHNCAFSSCIEAPADVCNVANSCTWCSAIGYCRASGSCVTTCAGAGQSVCNAASQCSWCGSLGGWCRKKTEVCVSTCSSLTPRGSAACNAPSQCQWCAEHNGRCKPASELCLTESQSDSRTAAHSLSFSDTASRTAVATRSSSSSVSASRLTSLSSSTSLTGTLSPSSSTSPTTTGTTSLSITASASRSTTPSRSLSFSSSASPSPTNSMSRTLTTSISSTRSVSRTGSTSASSTVTRTTTYSPSASTTPSVSGTSTSTRTASMTATPSTSLSTSKSRTATRSASRTQQITTSTTVSSSQSSSVRSASDAATASASSPESSTASTSDSLSSSGSPSDSTSSTASTSDSLSSSGSITASTSNTAALSDTAATTTLSHTHTASTSPSGTVTVTATSSMSPSSSHTVTKSKSLTSTDSPVDLSPRISSCFSEQSVYVNSEFVVTVSGQYLAESDTYLVAEDRFVCLQEPSAARVYHGVFWLSVDRTEAVIRYTVNDTAPFSICYRSAQLGRVYKLSCPQVFYPQPLAPWANVSNVLAAASSVAAIAPNTSLAAFNYGTCVSAYLPSVNMNPSLTGGILSSPVAGTLQFGNASNRIRSAESCMVMVSQGTRPPPGRVPTVDAVGWNALNASSVFDFAYEFQLTSYLSDDDVLLIWMPTNHSYVQDRRAAPYENTTSGVALDGGLVNTTALAEAAATTPSCPLAVPGFTAVHRVAYGLSSLRLPSSEAFMITACSSVGASRGQYAAIAYTRAKTVCPNDCRDGTGIQRGVCANTTTECLCSFQDRGLGGADCARPTACNSTRTNMTTNITHQSGFWAQGGVGHCAALLRADGRYVQQAGGFGIGIHITRFNLTNPDCAVAAVVLRRGGPRGSVLRRLCANDTETLTSDASPTILVLETERAVFVEYIGATVTDVVNVSFASISTSCPGVRDVAGYVQPWGQCHGKGECVNIDLSQLRQLPLSTKSCACFSPWAPSQPGASCDACGYGRQLWTYPHCSPIPTCAWDCNRRGTCTAHGCRCDAPYYGRLCELMATTAHVQAASRMATRLSFDRGSGASAATAGESSFLSCQLTSCRTTRRTVGNAFYAASPDALLSLADDNNTAPGATAAADPSSSLPPSEAAAVAGDSGAETFAFSTGLAAAGPEPQPDTPVVEGDEGIQLNPVRTPSGAGDYFAQDSVAGTVLDVHGATTITMWAKLTRSSNGFLFAKVDTARYADGRIPLLELAFHDIQNRHAPLDQLFLRYTNTSIYFAVYVNGDRGRIDVMSVDVGLRDGETAAGGSACSTQTCGGVQEDDEVAGARGSGRDRWFYSRHFALNGRYRGLLFDGQWHFLAITLRRGSGRWEGQVYIDGGSIDGNINFVQCLPFLPSAVSNFSLQHAEANAIGDPEVTVVAAGASVVVGYGLSGSLDEARIYAPPLTQMSLVKIGGPDFNAALSISTNALLLCSAVCIVTVVGAATLFVSRREGVRLDAVTHEQHASSSSSSSSSADGSNDDDDPLSLHSSDDDVDPSGARKSHPSTVKQITAAGSSASSDDGFYDLILGDDCEEDISPPLATTKRASSEIDALRAAEDQPSATVARMASDRLRSDRKSQRTGGVVFEASVSPHNATTAQRKRSDATSATVSLPGSPFSPVRRKNSALPLQLEDVDGTELVMENTLDCSIDWDGSDGGDEDGAAHDDCAVSASRSAAWSDGEGSGAEHRTDAGEGSGKSVNAERRASRVSFTSNPLAPRSSIPAGQRKDSLFFNQGNTSASFFSLMRGGGDSNDCSGTLNRREGVSSFLEDRDARRLYRAMSVSESRSERANRKLRSALVAVTNTLTTSVITTTLGSGNSVAVDAMSALSEGITAGLHAWQTLGLHIGGFPWPEIFEANIGNIVAVMSLSFETSLNVSFELGFYACGAVGLVAFAVQAALLMQDALQCGMQTPPPPPSVSLADVPSQQWEAEAIDEQKKNGNEIEQVGDHASVNEPPRSTREKIAWASLFTLTSLYMPITRYAVIGAFCYRTIQCEFDCYNESKHWRIVYVSAVLMLCVTLFTPLLLVTVTFLKRRQFAGNRIDDAKRDEGGLVANHNKALERDWRKFLLLDRSPYAGAYESFKYQWVYFQTVLIVSKALCVFLALGLDSNTTPQMVCITVLHSVFAFAVALASPFIADVSNIITVVGQLFLVGTLAVNAISRIDPDETVGMYSGYALIACAVLCLAIQAALLARHLSFGDIVDGIRGTVTSMVAGLRGSDDKSRSREHKDDNHHHQLGDAESVSNVAIAPT